MKAIPWTYEARPDTRTTNARVGVWLFLASEAMFFASLFSGYVLLRTGSASWPDAGAMLDLRLALVNTALLLGAGVLMAFHRALPAAALGTAFLALKMFEYRSKLDAGLHPATNILLACWFTLTAVHALHVAAGAAVNVWLAATAKRLPSAHAMERLHAARLYWFFVDIVWVVILVAFYAF
jgi:heme/copper-type cytochrome/quinol oxidase subunit 3